MASKLYGVNATIKIFVFVLYCMCPYNYYNLLIQPAQFNPLIQPAQFKPLIQPAQFNPLIQTAQFNPQSFIQAAQPTITKSLPKMGQKDLADWVTRGEAPHGADEEWFHEEVGGEKV